MLKLSFYSILFKIIVIFTHRLKTNIITLTKGTKLEVDKQSKMFIGIIKAIFQDYYLVSNRRGGVNYVYEGEYKVI